MSLRLRISPFCLLLQHLFIVLNILYVTLGVNGKTSKFFLGDRKPCWRVPLYKSGGGRRRDSKLLITLTALSGLELPDPVCLIAHTLDQSFVCLYLHQWQNYCPLRLLNVAVKMVLILTSLPGAEYLAKVQTYHCIFEKYVSILEYRPFTYLNFRSCISPRNLNSKIYSHIITVHGDNTQNIYISLYRNYTGS